MTSTAHRDRILVRDLRVFAHHGVLPHEAERGQVFVLDLDLSVDLEAAGRSDDLERTIDYGGLTERVATSRRRLLEAVASDVAELVLADERVHEVRVRITKPHAPIRVDAVVAVEVVRGRGGGCR
jgi:dihydroneopterin aldolase